MKTIRLLIIAVAISVASLTFTGCVAPRTAEARVYDTFKTTYNAAYSSYESYCKLVVLGKVSKAEEAKVDAAWNDFRAASLNWTAATPAQVQKLADDLNRLILSL